MPSSPRRPSSTPRQSSTPAATGRVNRGSPAAPSTACWRLWNKPPSSTAPAARTVRRPSSCWSRSRQRSAISRQIDPLNAQRSTLSPRPASPCSASSGNARASRTSARSPTTSPRPTAVAHGLRRRLRRHGRASAAMNWRSEFDADHDEYNSIMTKALADRLAEAFAEYLHEQARTRSGATGQPGACSNERPDRRKVPRHPPRLRLPRLPGPHAESGRCSTCSTPRRRPASR